MNYTNEKQSKKLASLGINIDTASLVWQCISAEDDIQYSYAPILWEELDFLDTNYGIDENESQFHLPCWTEGDLINVIKSIVDNRYNEFKIEVYNNKWYVYFDDNIISPEGIHFQTHGEKLFDAVYKMILLLRKHNYL